MKQTLTLQGRWTFTLKDAKTGKIKRKWSKNNVVCVNGKNAIAHYMGGGVTYDAKPNYIAVGSDNTTVAASDTTLGTETFRKGVTTKSYEADGNNAKLYVATYLTTSEGNGTIEEVGLFTDATATADSGQLLSHVNDTITKTSSDTLQLEFELTIS